jgi:hypothetical protein
MKNTRGHQDGVLINGLVDLPDACDNSLPLSAVLHIRAQAVSNSQPGRRPSPELDHVDTLVSDFNLQNCERINFCCL